MSEKPRALSPRFVCLRLILGLIVTAAMLFGPAGRLDYWQGWVLLLLILLVTSAQLVLFRHDREFVMERMRPGAGVKGWDRWVLSAIGLATLSTVILGALDSGRFNWTTSAAWPLYWGGYVSFLLSVGLFTWAMKVNRYFSSVVRIQLDRGQSVVTKGPYAIVRHPGYVGGITLAFSLALMLGSYWALLPALLAAVLLVVRTWLEDQTLKHELSGYKEYAHTVTSRLLPGIW